MCPRCVLCLFLMAPMLPRSKTQVQCFEMSLSATQEAPLTSWGGVCRFLEIYSQFLYLMIFLFCLFIYLFIYFFRRLFFILSLRNTFFISLRGSYSSRKRKVNILNGTGIAVSWLHLSLKR